MATVEITRRLFDSLPLDTLKRISCIGQMIRTMVDIVPRADPVAEPCLNAKLKQTTESISLFFK